MTAARIFPAWAWSPVKYVSAWRNGPHWCGQRGRYPWFR